MSAGCAFLSIPLVNTLPADGSVIPPGSQGDAEVGFFGQDERANLRPVARSYYVIRRRQTGGSAAIPAAERFGRLQS